MCIACREGVIFKACSGPFKDGPLLDPVIQGRAPLPVCRLGVPHSGNARAVPPPEGRKGEGMLEGGSIKSYLQNY